MALLDGEGKVVWINGSMEKLTGFTLEDFQAKGIANSLAGPDTDREKLASVLKSMARNEKSVEEFLAYKKNGEPYWLSGSNNPIVGEDGEHLGFVIVHRDITERKALETELIASRDELAVRVEERTQTIMNQALELEKALAAERELNRMQTEFVSMASHEFRTPLTIIDGVARRLDKRAEKWTPEEIREKSGSIRNTVKRMTMLVERTLDASRLSSGRIKLTPERFGIRDLLQEVCDRQKEVAPSHRIDLDISGYPETLYGDARLMDNVFTNLLSNAVKYSGENKRVTITGTQAEGQAVLRVRDHGIGIPKDELPKIFTRFFRASTSTGIPGTGIGLNLVKSLVDMHYGEIELDSVEGEWTEFTVRLPLVSPLETGDLPEDDLDEACFMGREAV